MSSKNNKTWMIRAGERARFIDYFLENNLIAIGWTDLEEIETKWDYETLKSDVRETYPDQSDGYINQSTSQIWKFVHDFKIGDQVITYDPSTRQYYRGKIKSGYTYEPDTEFEFHNVRKVEWEEYPYDRDAFDTATKNTLGSILTLFELPETIVEEFEKHSPYPTDEEMEEMEQVAAEFERQQMEGIKEDLINNSNEFIKDLFVKLTWHEMELLTAGIFRAMGYKTRMTSRGSDLGSDILASPDGLGMLEPRIKIEVKHKIKSKDKIGAPDIRNFVGGLRSTEKGIYVSTSGFTKEGLYESERANFNITLVDSDYLVELLLENYEKLDMEIKSMVPLRKIYWPV